MSELEHRGRVTVYGADIRRPPLVDGNEPEMVMIRDEFGDPMILLFRHLSGDTWGLSTRGDEDFMEMLVKYGFAQIKPGVSPKDVIAKGVAPFAELTGK